MKKLSYKVALGGIIAALALLVMFLTGLGPFLTYLCPMTAGILLVAVVIEISKKWAFATYCAIALLSAFITPDKEAAMLFIAFFGYYPILKSILEKMKFRVLEWVCKFAVFNVSVISAYWILMNVFGMGQILDALGEWGKYGILIFILAANAVFVLYDLTVSNIAITYINKLRPILIRKLK